MGLFGSIGKSVGAVFNPSEWGGSNDPIFGGSLGDFIPGVGDARAANAQNAANQRNAQNQMDFQERMSNSAYQRATDDMKKAGINPMLAYSQGGASTPSGALPAVNSETKSKLGEFAMSSALGIKNSGIAQQQANTSQASAEQGIDLSKAQTAKTIADTQKTQVETTLAKKGIPAAKLQNELTEKGSSLVNKIVDSIQNSAVSSKNSKKSFFDQWKNLLSPNPQPTKPTVKPKTGNW